MCKSAHVKKFNTIYLYTNNYLLRNKFCTPDPESWIRHWKSHNESSTFGNFILPLSHIK